MCLNRIERTWMSVARTYACVCVQYARNGKANKICFVFQSKKKSVSRVNNTYFWFSSSLDFHMISTHTHAACYRYDCLL